MHNCAQLRRLYLSHPCHHSNPIHHSHPSHPIHTSHSGHPSHLSHPCHPSNPIPHSHPSHPIDHFHYIKIHTWLMGIKQKKCLLLSLKIISFVLFPPASEPSVNFNNYNITNGSIHTSHPRHLSHP